MNTRENESVIAALKAQVADLEERVSELEQRAGRHDCSVDLCSHDAYGNCLLRPAGDVWGYDLTGDPYEDAEVIQS